MNIELTEQEVRDLAVLLDAAVRAMGIKAVKATAPILDRLDAAMAAQPMQAQPGKRKRGRPCKPNGAPEVEHVVAT